jgi:protein disulfide-isomerase
MKNFLIIISFAFLSNLNAQQNTSLSTKEAKEGLVWYNDLTKAIPLSLSTNKPLLLFFTGSDWCGWCIRLQREVFAYDAFKKWTDENVILVELDFPRRKQLPQNILQQNRELQQIFGVRGYPTVWLVTPQVVKSTDPNNPADKINFFKHGSLGYVAGGPDKWIPSANKFLVTASETKTP